MNSKQLFNSLKKFIKENSKSTCTIKQTLSTLNNGISKKFITTINYNKTLLENKNNKYNLFYYKNLLSKPFTSYSMKMPKVVESINEGDLNEWHISDYVEEGDLLASIGTYKTQIELRSSHSGIVEKLKFDVGESFTVDDDLIVINTKVSGENLSNNNNTKSNNLVSKEEINKNIKEQNTNENKETYQKDSNKEKLAAIKKTINDNESSNSFNKSHNNDIKSNKSSENTINNNNQYNLSTLGIKMTEISGMRKIINNKLKEVCNEKAVLSTFNECDLTFSTQILNNLSKEYEKKHKIPLISTDNQVTACLTLFIYSMTKAIKQFPIINAVIDKSLKNIIYRDYVDMIVPIKLVNDADLVVNCVVRDCQNKTFTEIYKELLSFNNKFTSGQLSLEDTYPGTVSINTSSDSLLSVSAIEENTTVKLGINKAEMKPYCVDNNPKRIEPRMMMYISLTYDHRLIDGREGVLFLKKVKEYMENPIKIIFDM